MRIVGILASLGLMLASFAVATPVAAGDPCFHDMSRPPVTQGNATVVKMDVCAFVPTIVHVPVGTEVQFLNTDVVGHEVVGANLTWGHHDKILQSGDQLGATFVKAGIYPFACMIHPGMTGAVIVGDGMAVDGSGPAVVQMIGGASFAPDASASERAAAAAPTVVSPPNAALAAATTSPAASGSPVTAAAVAAVAIVLGGAAALVLFHVNRRRTRRDLS